MYRGNISKHDSYVCHSVVPFMNDFFSPGDCFNCYRFTCIAYCVIKELGFTVGMQCND